MLNSTFFKCCKNTVVCLLVFIFVFSDLPLDFLAKLKIPDAKAATQTITIGATAGGKVANLSSGNINQTINSSSCSASSSCAAFTLYLDSTPSRTLQSFKITETGTVNASLNLSNAVLYYDTDGNYSNGVTGQYGATTTVFTSETVDFSGSLSLSAGTTYYFYLQLDVKSSTTTYPVGGEGVEFEVAATSDIGTTGAPIKVGTPTLASAGSTCATTSQTCILPQITTYDNTTEASANFDYSASCTTCGARIGPGSAFRQTITISGFGFGADPGLGSRDSSTSSVKITTSTAHTIQDDGSANTNVSAWSNTSITIRTDTNITSDTDTDWGTNYGGTTALNVTAGGQTASTSLPFFIFPQVTSLTVPTSVANAAREDNTADSDGVITLNGTRFGSSSSTGWVRVLGCDAITCSSPSGSATTTSWSSTAIMVKVPPVIADNSYTGNIDMQQGAGTYNKQHTYASTFRVLPRITSFNPTTANEGNSITIYGDHLCQNAGTCPGAIDANNKVGFFQNKEVTSFFTWLNTSVSTTVPTGTVTGNVVVTSSGFASNGKSLTILGNTPNDPTSLNQYKNSALTQTIAVSSTVSSSPVYFGMIMQAGTSGGTLYAQIEIKPTLTSFACTTTSACTAAQEGTGVAGPGPVDCNVAANSCAISSSTAEGGFHWQARVRHNKGGTDYYSNWISFGSNPENEDDFFLDTIGPVITNVSHGTPGNNSAIITWDTTGEQSTSQVQYNLTGTFGSSCSGDCTTLDSNRVNSHSVSLSNLGSGTLYYYRVRSSDAAGNLTSSTVASFTTASVTQPAKTTSFHISSRTGMVTGGTTTSSLFSVFMPETSLSIKSAFVELTGLSTVVGTNNVQIGVNSQASSTYAIASGASFFKILYLVSSENLNTDPTTNTLYVTPSIDSHIISARIIVTYSFTP